MREWARTTTPETTLPAVAEGVLVPMQRQGRRLTVEGRLVPRRESRPFLAEVRWRRILTMFGAFPFVGAGGYVAGRLGADVIGQVLAAVGAFLAVALLVGAGAKVSHRRHCPGCSDH